MISKEILHVLANFWIYFVWFYYARFFKLIFFPKMHIGVWSYITVMILLSFWSVWFSLHWHCAVFKCYFLSLFMTSVFYAKNVFNVFLFVFCFEWDLRGNIHLLFGCVNVCGLLYKICIPEFKQYVTSFDVFSCSESHLDGLDVIELEDYTCVLKNRKQRFSKRSGGIATFVKKEFYGNFEEISTYWVCSVVQASTVDYVISSANALHLFADFNIDDFCPLHSDVHSPITFNL